MEDKSQKKSQINRQLQDEINQSKKATNSQPNDSRLLERYQSFFTKELIREWKEEMRSRGIQKIFQREGIKYDPLAIHQAQIGLSLIKKSVNSEAVVLEARWGHFQIQLNILNVLKESFIHHRKHTLGSYGKIYHAEILGSSFVIKCINFSRQQFSREAVQMTVKEYILLKIASVLQIGPMVKEIIGFDLIIHENCIEFAIQKCEQIDKISQEEVANLKKNLYLMHMFGIVHFDIKPSNIMFSQHFKKYVFIDFGLSEIMSVKIGQKIQIFFRGTLDFCSEQMAEAFKFNEPKFVDVFYNDVHGLQRSFDERFIDQIKQKELYEQGVQYVSENSSFPSYKADSSLLVHLVKYLIFRGKQQELTRVLKLQTKLLNEAHVQEDLLIFFYQLTPTEQLRQFYRKHITTYKKESTQFDEINQIYSSKCLFFRTIKPNQQKRTAFQNNISIMKTIMNNFPNFTHNKANIMKLFSKKKQKNSYLIQLFSIYMEFINFSNNVHQINIAERVEISKKLYENDFVVKERQNILCNDEIVTIQTAIDDIFKQLMNECNQYTSISRFILDLMYDLIEHMFILNFLSEEELMRRLKSAYQIHNLTYEDKLEFILKIKHFNYWFLYRLNTKNSKQNPFILFRAVNKWLMHINLEQSHEQHPNIWVCKQMLRIWANPYSGELSSVEKTMTYKLPKHLYIQFNLEIQIITLTKIPTDQINNHISGIYKLIDEKHKRKIYFFVFSICELLFLKLGQFQKGNLFKSLIIQNLQCQEIINSISLMRIQDLIVNSNYKKKMQTLLFYIESIDHIGVSINPKLLVLGLPKIKDKQIQNLQQQQLVGKILNKLHIIQNSISLLDYFPREQKDTMHVCIDIQTGFDMIQIKKIYYYLFEIPSQWPEDLKRIKQNLTYVVCQNCHFITKNICEIQAQNSIINQYYINPSSQLAQAFLETYNSMMNSSESAYNKSSFSIYYRQLMALFCGFKRQIEAQHQGILSLYYFLKKTNQMVYYLNKDETNYRILCLTLEVVGRVSCQELVSFMNLLTKYIHNNYDSNYFLMLNRCFIKFVQQFSRKINFKQMAFCIQEYRKREQNKMLINPFNSLYYYYFLLFVPQMQALCQRRIVQCLGQLPYSVRLYLQGHYYRYLLGKSTLKSFGPSFNYFQTRKYNYFLKKTVKIFFMINKRKIKARLQRTMNLKVRTLEKKAKNLGGPFNLYFSNLNEVYVKVRKA